MAVRVDPIIRIYAPDFILVESPIKAAFATPRLNNYAAPMIITVMR